MNGFGRFVIVIDWILVVAVSVCGVLWALMPGTLAPEPEGAEMPALKVTLVEFINDISGQMTLVIAGGLLVLMNILLVIRLLRQSSYQRSIRFQNPGGEVIVHLGAVEECLTRSARESDDVHDVKVRVFSSTQERPIRLVVAASLWDAPDIPSIIEKLQGKLRGRFMEILNTEEPIDVVVTLKRLVTKKEVKSRAPESASSPVESGFRGPEYPID